MNQKKKGQLYQDINDGYWVYDDKGKKTNIITDMFGNKWTVKDALASGLLEEKKSVEFKYNST